MKTYQSFSTRKTSQQEPIPGKNMVRNNADGFAFAVDEWTRLDRFLVLGSEGGTYYIKERELTKHNAENVLKCIEFDGVRVVKRIEEISVSGRAPKNDPALFALAMAFKLGGRATRQAAAKTFPKVARIGTHLFHFVAFAEQFGGWGRLTRETIANWYNDMKPGKLAYQVVKYQQRDGWSHRDVLRLAHPNPASETHNAIYHYVTKGTLQSGDEHLSIISAFEQAKRAENKDEIVKLIYHYGLTREMVPTKWLNAPDVWEALLEKMPLTAMIRNLGKMTNVELLVPMSQAVLTVCSKLRDKEYIHKSRVHPLAVLVALKIYQQGHGMRGSLTWTPVRQIVDSLDNTFYAAFDNVESTGKRIMLALDVSGSMVAPISGMPLSCREASAALALTTARTEQNYMFTMFSSGRVFGGNGLSPLDISPRQRLDDVIKRISGLPFGGTDCALPMLYAAQNNLKIDTFVVYTDNETWAGNIHPCQALQMYRERMSIPAKLVVVGMTSNGFSIADPDDAGMLDVVGFDTATPQVVANFMK